MADTVNTETSTDIDPKDWESDGNSPELEDGGQDVAHTHNQAPGPAPGN